MEEIIENCLNDIETQIIEEEMSYQFYDKSVNTVKYIGPQKQFKEMMWEEFNHVKVLRDKYKELGGNKEVEYNIKQHGGFAMPSKKINTEVVFDIGIKEEKDSIFKYDNLSKKYKDHNLSSLFDSLLKDERKHLSVWENAQMEYISTGSKPFGKSKTYPTYRFTPTDLNIIDKAVKYGAEYFETFCCRVKSLHIVECREIILSIVKKENEHIKLLENEYFRLKNIKPCERKKLTNNQSTTNECINDKEVIEKIIDDEKDHFTQIYDWGRMCTNTQLQDILWNMMDVKYNHLKQWAKIL